jgi:hypothetical protein
MTERWCKLYPHALTDPMWLAVADDAGTSPGLVGATFVELLTWTTEHAPDTGSIAGFDPRVWAAWLRIAPEAVERIIASLRKFGRLAGDTIANWAKRQGTAAVAMVRKVSTPRVRKHRQRAGQGELLLPIAGVKRDETPFETAMKRDETPRREERERSSETDSQDFKKEDAGVSRRSAPLSEVKAKRANLIKTLRRWARLSPHLDEDERLPRLQMLDRAVFALDDWDCRSTEDKRCFDILAARARASPLDDQVISWVRQAEKPGGGFRPLGEVITGAA